ncbi:hypothetical protein VIGAN_05096200 [Vigna angularis var. angularis]|uniref:Uncharacterized protein n=1 Tax=Vigna angularis var. angularis TaxID=157739 RepID=A0A0S3S408_PHAAN|nr:hypothetical protein VIGAN_05096200 [Vigna angularis var. angularis]
MKLLIQMKQRLSCIQATNISDLAFEARFCMWSWQNLLLGFSFLLFLSTTRHIVRFYISNTRIHRLLLFALRQFSYFLNHIYCIISLLILCVCVHEYTRFIC